MKSKATLAGLLLVLVFTSLSFKCDGGAGGPSDEYKKAAKAADDIAASINAMIKIKRELGQAGSITPDQERKLTDLLLKANTADKEFVKQIRALKANPDPSAKATLCTLFTSVTSALTDLNNNGIGPVTDPTAKNKLATIFNSLAAASGIIAGVGLCG
jgi:hypothetical protein